jgi:hypothetical protein
MGWLAYFHPKFVAEVDGLSPSVQDALAVSLALLREFGPSLGRPDVDTLNGSKFANMKELRFKADGGVWLSLSIHNGTRFCWLLRINRE